MNDDSIKKPIYAHALHLCRCVRCTLRKGWWWGWGQDGEVTASHSSLRFRCGAAEFPRVTRLTAGGGVEGGRGGTSRLIILSNYLQTLSAHMGVWARICRRAAGFIIRTALAQLEANWNTMRSDSRAPRRSEAVETRRRRFSIAAPWKEWGGGRRIRPIWRKNANRKWKEGSGSSCHSGYVTAKPSEDKQEKKRSQDSTGTGVKMGGCIPPTTTISSSSSFSSPACSQPVWAAGKHIDLA